MVLHRRSKGLLWMVCAILWTACASLSTQEALQGRLTYPETRRDAHVDQLHGVTVADPYRWLEDLNGAETKAWIEAQNKVTFSFLSSIPERPRIQERLRQVWNYTNYGVPRRAGERYFFLRKDGLQNQPVLYVTKGLNGTPKVLIDPNTLSEDGTVALHRFSPSPDGRYLAYSISKSGSDWVEIFVRDVSTGKDLTDHVSWVKFSGISWWRSKDKKTLGFFYSRYDAPEEGKELDGSNRFHRVHFHRLGDAASADTLVYERKDHADWGFYAGVTDDQRYLILQVWQGTSPKNGVFYAPLNGDDPTKWGVVSLLEKFDAGYHFVGNHGATFFFRTDHSAPRGRIIAIDTKNPGVEKWVERVSEQTEALQSVLHVGGRFIGHYLKDARSVLRVFSTGGARQDDIALPGMGTARKLRGKSIDDEAFFSFSSFTFPAAVYRYDVIKNVLTVFRKPKLDVRPDRFETRQVFYKSKDGTKVPMFITHLKGLKLDGSNPTYLYGYGGFNIPITPGFSPALLTWLEMGGIYAVPNLRGGSEYGEDWHRAGMLDKKQNVFDDFIGAAEWLIENRYTRTDRLAVAGYSNGGLLIGAVMTQRPELFAAALPGVGVLDMLRFHKFTIGWAWMSEYGSPDKADQFQTLLKYSPYHNLKKGTAYPATMVTTADHDDRVVPIHSFKFAARLQHVHKGPKPVLIRIETKAGHGAGKPTSKKIEEHADRWSFLLKVFKFSLPAGFGGQL